MERFLEIMVKYVAFGMEIISISIIIIFGTKALYVFINEGFKFNNMRVSLIIAEGLNMSLGFLLAAEITSSIVIKTIPNLIVLFGTAALRIGLTFVLHWEIGQYEKVLDQDDPKGSYYKDTELKSSKKEKENK